MATTEEKLLAHFSENGVEAIGPDGDRPAVRSAVTGRLERPDIHLPATDLCIEVKGQMPFYELRKIRDLAERQPNYYLYQYTDYEWNVQVEDWPRHLRGAKELGAIEERAREERESYELRRPPRQTRGRGVKPAGQLQYNIHFQRQELLLMSQHEEFALCASEISIVRLVRHIGLIIDEFRGYFCDMPDKLKAWRDDS